MHSLFETDPYPGKPKILFIGHGDSTHVRPTFGNYLCGNIHLISSYVWGVIQHTPSPEETIATLATYG